MTTTAHGKQYVLGVWEPVGPTPPAEFLEPVMKALGALQEEMAEAGAWVFSAGLHQPESSTVVRKREDGELLTTDGPYVEAKEHLGGFTVVRADDLDGALRWANRMADIIGLPVEVRPLRHGGTGEA